MCKRRKNGIRTYSFIIAKNSLHTVKGLAANLKKNGPYICIFEAYQMIDDVRSILKEMRTNIDKEFQDWPCQRSQTNR